jgi:hypothetical protein
MCMLVILVRLVVTEQDDILAEKFERSVTQNPVLFLKESYSTGRDAEMARSGVTTGIPRFLPNSAQSNFSGIDPKLVLNVRNFESYAGDAF